MKSRPSFSWVNKYYVAFYYKGIKHKIECDTFSLALKLEKYLNMRRPELNANYFILNNPIAENLKGGKDIIKLLEEVTEQNSILEDMRKK